MKKYLLIIAIAVIFMTGCDMAGVIPNEDDGYYTYSISNLEFASEASVDQELNSTINSRMTTNIGVVSVESINNTRSLVDDGNIVNFINFDNFMLLESTDGEVFITTDDTTATSVNTMLGVTDVYMVSAQVRGNYLFIGADNTLYRINIMDNSYISLNDPTNTATDDIAGRLFGTGAGVERERLFFMVDSEGDDIIAYAGSAINIKYKIHISGSTVTSSEISSAFSDSMMVITGDRYYKVDSNMYFWVDNDGVAHFDYDADTLRYDLFNLGEERWFLSDNEFYFTNGRYDAEKIGNVVIPKTSTFIQDWYNKVYTMHDTERFYVRINDNGAINIYHLVFTNTGVTTTETAYTGSYSDFVAADNTVNDFWILNDGTVTFTDPGLEGNARYTTL